MVAEKLNALAENLLKKPAFGNDNLGVRFYQGDAFDAVKKIVSVFAPCGKVAFVTTLKTNLLYCTSLVKAIKSTGAVMTTMVVEDFSTSIESASILFSLPDDVRMIIVMDSEVMNDVLYFASLKKLPVIVIPTTYDVGGTLRNKIYIKTNDKIDGISVKVMRHVIIDKSLMANTESQGFAFIMSKFVSLIDYRINSAIFSSSISKKAFDAVKQSVLSTFEITSLEEKSRSDVLIYNAFQIEMAAALTKGEIVDFSAENIAQKISGETENKSEVALIFALGILKMYYETARSQFGVCGIIDLNAISDAMEKRTKIDSSVFLKNYVAQIKAIDKNTDKTVAIFKSMKDEIFSFVRLSDKIKATFVSLGGTIPRIDGYSFAISHSGDWFVGANGMTVIREAGLLKNR